ncbi:MAG: FAD-dependent oxidoreductase [Bacteroidota bacterium]
MVRKLLIVWFSLIPFANAKAQEEVYDVIIIGGGLSGLTAAYYLETNNYLVLEKEEKVGGRVIGGQWKGFHYPKGTEYIGEPEGVLKEVIEELGLEVVAVPPPTDGIAYQGQIYTRRQLLDFLPSRKQKRQFRGLGRKLNRLARGTEDFIWEGDHLKKKYRELDGTPVKKWLETNEVHPLIQHYIEVENLGLFSANNEELSILYNASEMAYNLPSPRDYEESEVFTFPRGMIELSDALENEIQGKIMYQAEVVKVVKEAEFIRVEAILGNKKINFKAKNIVCATPAPISGKILEGSISEKAKQQLSSIRYGQYVTINIFTKKRFLNQAWTVTCLDNYFTSIYDVTRGQTSSDHKGESIISAYIPSYAATDSTFINQTDREVFKKTIQGMETYFPSITASVVDYDIQRFKYAYPVFGLGYSKVLEVLNTDESLQENIFLAGDYMTYAVVDGAILSGYLAAQKVNAQKG